MFCVSNSKQFKFNTIIVKIIPIGDEFFIAMRRAAFYMGRTYTTRHLNAVRSPLTTGFIRPMCTSTSMANIENAFITSGATALSGTAISNSVLCEDGILGVGLETVIQRFIEVCNTNQCLITFFDHACVLSLQELLCCYTQRQTVC